MSTRHGLSDDGLVLLAEMLSNQAIDPDAVWDHIRRQAYWQSHLLTPCAHCGQVRGEHGVRAGLAGDMWCPGMVVQRFQAQNGGPHVR